MMNVRSHLNEDNPKYDLNKDGKINILDMIFVRNQIGENCVGNYYGKVYIEGPIERGEIRCIYSSEFTIDIYAQGMYRFQGFQIGLKFTDNSNTVLEFPIAMGGSELFGGRKITYNEEFFPEIYAFAEGNLVGFLSTEREYDRYGNPRGLVDKTIGEKTWLMSITYETVHQKHAVIDVDEDVTTFGNSEERGIPFHVVPSHFYYCQPMNPYVHQEILSKTSNEQDEEQNLNDHNEKTKYSSQLSFISNKLGQNVSEGNNSEADLNKDGKINILDMIIARNNPDEEWE